MYYYRGKDAKEIDLLMERDGKLFPMEIKKTATPEKSFSKPSALLKSPRYREGLALFCVWQIG